MSEKDMREILAEMVRLKPFSDEIARGGAPLVPFGDALRAMQEVERRTKAAELFACWDISNRAISNLSPGAGRTEMIAVRDAIRALQDAPSDDTPPARKAELWSDGNG